MDVGALHVVFENGGNPATTVVLSVTSLGTNYVGCVGKEYEPEHNPTHLSDVTYPDDERFCLR